MFSCGFSPIQVLCRARSTLNIASKKFNIPLNFPRGMLHGIACLPLYLYSLPFLSRLICTEVAFVQCADCSPADMPVFSLL